jgi:hypothetical protein
VNTTRSKIKVGALEDLTDENLDDLNRLLDAVGDVVGHDSNVHEKLSDKHAWVIEMLHLMDVMHKAYGKIIK